MPIIRLDPQARRNVLANWVEGEIANEVKIDFPGMARDLLVSEAIDKSIAGLKAAEFREMGVGKFGQLSTWLGRY